MRRLLFALPFLFATVAIAQELPLGRVLTINDVSVVLMPLNPPPPVVQPLTVPDAFQVSGSMVSVNSADSSVDCFSVSVRVETASGAP